MSPRTRSLLLALACLALGAAASVWLGQDTGWDLRNYHLANPYAATHGRLDVDLDPAGLQSYFNPTLDLVYYGLGTGPLAHWPRLLAALMGLPYGALIFLTLCVVRTVFPGPPGAARLLAIGATTAAAVTGAGTLTQVGTAFNEVTIAAWELAGLALVLPALGDGPRRGRCAAAGVAMGFGAGLKLTALVFAPAFALALLVTGWRRIGPTLWFCAGWLAGFAAPAGWWGFLVWRKFGNPVFPLFNDLFRSPWYPPVGFMQAAFLPRTTLQWLFYPFWWATWRVPALNTEIPYRDPRLAAGLVAAAALAGLGLARRRPLSREFTFVLLFAVLSYLLWLRTSAIMRYGVVLEVLSVVLAAGLLRRLVGRPWPRALAIAAAAAACMAWTVVPDYGRVAFGPTVFDVDMDWTPPGTLFVALTGPTAYVTVFVPKSAGARTVGFSFVNVGAPDSRLTAATAAAVRDNPGPIYVLIPFDDHSMPPHLGLIGLDPALGPCRHIHSNLDGSATEACLAHRLPR